MQTMDRAELEAAMAATGAIIEELTSTGAFVFAGGLMPPSSAITVDNTGESLSTVSGPFVEAPEYLGGFWVIDVADDPHELEKRQVKGAIRTDFILSAEIMAIALNELGDMSIKMQAGALALVAIAITAAVYGVVAIIVKLDDVGLHLVQRQGAAMQAFGRGLVHIVPGLLTSLSSIGTFAMLWVGGGILLHGIEKLGFELLPHVVHDVAATIASYFGPLEPIMEWLTGAIAASILGLFIGGIIVVIVRQFTKHPEELIVD